MYVEDLVTLLIGNYEAILSDVDDDNTYETLCHNIKHRHRILLGSLVPNINNNGRKLYLDVKSLDKDKLKMLGFIDVGKFLHLVPKFWFNALHPDLELMHALTGDKKRVSQILDNKYDCTEWGIIL